MTPQEDESDGSVIDRVVEYSLATLPDRDDLESGLRHYYSHVDPSDLEGRRVEDLFGLAVDHLQLATGWQDGAITIDVANPRAEVDGWGSDHTIVRIITDDMPFLVDSVTMELSRLGIGIHLIVHPVLSFDPARLTFDGSSELADDDRMLSLISVEIDRQDLDTDRQLLVQSLRRVLGDVRAAVRHWRDMRERMTAISASLDTVEIPIDSAEISEGRELLDWLCDDHFLFLGARDYELGVENGVDVLKIVDGSGLGILEGNEHLGRPRLISEMSKSAQERIREVRLLNLTKAGTRSTVHRASYLDYVGIKTFDSEGNVTGERRFLGLFTSEVYNRSATVIPRARRTVAEVVARAGFPAGGHDEKRLRTILERYPRDELLQMDVDELYDVSIAIAGLQERRRVRVFARRELFGRFVTVLVYLPRDRYNTDARSGIESILLDAYNGTLAEWDAQMSESVLARLRYVVRLEGSDDEIDAAELETRIEGLIRVWDDDFTGALTKHFGERSALSLRRTYGDAFGPDYKRAFEPRAAASDVEQIEALHVAGALRLSAYREPGRPTNTFKLKLYRRGERVSLTMVMPSLTNLGVTVVDERPYEVKPDGGDPVWIYDFALEYQGTDLDFATASVLVEDAFSAVWSGTAEDDGFNQLVLRAGLGATRVAVLRAYARYLQQIRCSYSPLFVEQTLARHPEVVRLLFDFFEERFDPDGAGDTAAIEQRIIDAIDTIESLDRDRVLRRFHNLIASTIRTTWHQHDGSGQPRPFLALKFDCHSIVEMPEPRPEFEIFVYSPRFEGVHLRSGPVARGGLRWSDRTEDYRTEVLGLVKAQMVKNAVIVPAGAKGGFVLKRAPDDPQMLRDEVVTCYSLFISALLDITDNLVDGEIVHPDRTKRYDGDDAYLVVAADKGTATFSDIANDLAMNRGFWLGDAFASGGSNGYDHKQMGITATGAWESVKRHFRELGTDVQSEPVTVAGIGDMSGDVFGNGMLRSKFIRLVAAFDHRHVFIDPDPDPAISYRERKRLFKQARSSWADYDPALLSDGGGVYERSAKSIELSPEAQTTLGIEATTITPDDLISAVLRAPVDLLWNGGIGTYIKGSDESHAEVGDKANDRIRIDGRDVRGLVIGEGGNLGVTQQGRVEFARCGGRIYTDAIDNAGGVDCSDHEVNIKILLDQVVANGDMTRKQRNELLAEMTSEVGMLVLGNSYRQSLALGMARIDAPSLVDVHLRYLDEMEQRGLLVRGLEALPDAEDLAERRLIGTGLSAPELAVVSAYTKNTLGDELLASDVPDNDALTPLLVEYFPNALQEQFSSRILTHQLRREIIANRLANLTVDRAGVSMIYRLGQETSAPAPEIAAAHFAAWEIFDLERLAQATNMLDGVLAVDRQLSIHLRCRQLAERATRLLLRNRPNPFDPASAIAELAEPVRSTSDELADALLGTDRQAFENEVTDHCVAGAPMELARQAAVLSTAVSALDIVAVAAELNAPVTEVAATHFAVANELELTWLRDRVLALPRDTQWSTLARLTLRTDLYADHRQLTALVIAAADGETNSVAQVEKWIQAHRPAVDRYRRTMVAIRSTAADLTTLLVAAREVRNLISRASP